MAKLAAAGSARQRLDKAFYANVVGAWVSEIEFDGLAGRPHKEVADCVSKRTLDLALSFAALLVLLPVLVLIAVAIWVETGGPIFFRQTRTGLGGRTFEILKFRSMSVAENGGEVRQAQKLDSRVTRVGAVLRALSLDELPQLLNIIKGDMSLVGPRPHALSHDEAWGRAVPAYAERFRTRPGLTGYAQVQGFRGEVRSMDDVRARVQADNDYIENWSLGLELSIMARTLPLLFNDPRAY